jgi:hypothetical protein
MAVKTITIDLEAYEALKRRKRHGASFSDVIKEHFRVGAPGRVVKATLSEIELDESTLDAVEELVRRREGDLARVPDL